MFVAHVVLPTSLHGGYCVCVCVLWWMMLSACALCLVHPNAVDVASAFGDPPLPSLPPAVLSTREEVDAGH